MGTKYLSGNLKGRETLLDLDIIRVYVKINRKNEVLVFWCVRKIAKSDY